MEAERMAAMHPSTPLAKARYSQAQLDHEADWNTYAAGGEKWFGFEAVRDLKGLPPEILLVPLVGHTWGHAGVAIDTGDSWLLHAGDAYFYRGEMEPRYSCTPGLRAYQTLMEVDRRQRLSNQRRLRQLIARHGAEVRVFSAHDALEYVALKEGVLERGDGQIDLPGGEGLAGSFA
jgi:glyoxylase-like metal-dependent hydrolase (beta-lactamase superfamily II)